MAAYFGNPRAPTALNRAMPSPALKRLPPSKRQYVRTHAAALLARQIPGAKAVPFPGFIAPSLATLHPKAPSGDRWVHEIKYDGYRLQLHVRQGEVRLFTRRGHDWTGRFESVLSAQTTGLAVGSPRNGAT
jgi:bifunctional non-homologous end joining protein LigD